MQIVKIFTIILVLLSPYALFAQGAKPGHNTLDTTVVEVMPQPKGGMAAFLDYFKKNFSYPPSALKDKVSGSVIVSFVVNKEGKITDCQVVKSVREDLDREALRLISNAPDWHPGYQKDRYVSVRMSMPIHFDAGSNKLKDTAGIHSKRKITSLQRLNKNAKTDSAYVIIYGTFIQRLGFSSGGFPQYIHLYNTDTEEHFSMLVKPTFKSARENNFCYLIKPGNYILTNYHWTQSKWYGGDTHVENIIKAPKAERRNTIQGSTSAFSFMITLASTFYVGTWDFSKTSISFMNDKLDIDEKIKNKHKKIDFKLADTSIPN